MPRTKMSHCIDECGKEVFQEMINGKIEQFEDYQCSKPHTEFRCFVFKKYKKKFEELEDDVAQLREHIKKINEAMFH